MDCGLNCCSTKLVVMFSAIKLSLVYLFIGWLTKANKSLNSLLSEAASHYTSLICDTKQSMCLCNLVKNELNSKTRTKKRSLANVDLLHKEVLKRFTTMRILSCIISVIYFSNFVILHSSIYCILVWLIILPKYWVKIIHTSMTTFE